MKTAAWVIFAAALSAGCTTAPRSDTERAALAAEIAARQGAQVDRLCFTRDINGWRALGDDAILLEKGVGDWYKLDLLGTCEPDWAFNAIAIRSRPGPALCLTEGDSVVTFETPLDGRCVITSIHEWNEDARVAGVDDD